MKLYLAPGACSLADHIALCEAGLEFERVRVDLRAKRTEDGRDFNEVNPKGYVPALVLDDGQLLTENVAILYWVAERAPRLAPAGELGRIRLIEMLAFIATELHKPFVRTFFPTSDAEKNAAEGIRQAARLSRRSAARRVPVREQLHRRRRLSVRDAALGAGQETGPARAAARLLRPRRSAPGRAARAAARRADLKIPLGSRPRGTWEQRGRRVIAPRNSRTIGRRTVMSKMNPVVHFEMPYDDRERMAKFYQNALGWQTQMLGEEMGNYVLATTTETEGRRPKEPGAINGGFFPRRPDWPAQHPSVVVAVDDIQAAMKKVAEAGGKVLGEPWRYRASASTSRSSTPRATE